MQDLKNRPGGDIGVHASILVAQTLLTAGVVDELRLVVAPTIAGAGRKLLDGLPPIRLAPIRSVISPTGYLILGYRVVEAGDMQRRRLTPPDVPSFGGNGGFRLGKREAIMAVTGFGGFFFRSTIRRVSRPGTSSISASARPKACTSGTSRPGRRCSPRSTTTATYFAADKRFMLNLRVNDLDGLLPRSKRRASRSSPRPNGMLLRRSAGSPGSTIRKATPIELWEPPAASA